MLCRSASYKGDDVRSVGKRARVLAAVLCVVAAACLVTGCRASDSLKEIVYDQSAEAIAYDNPNKVLINSSIAKQTSDVVAALDYAVDSKRATDETQNVVVYSSQPNAAEYGTKRSAFAKSPQFRGIEASESVFFYLSKEADAVDHPVSEEEDEPQETPEEPPAAGGAGAGTPNSSEGDDDTGDDGGDGDANAAPESPSVKPTEADEGKSDGGDVTVGYDSTDPNQDPEQVDKIAAYGEMAVVVQMVGGKNALAATDAKTLDGGFAKVFKTKDVARGWSDGGTAKGIDVDAIIKSGADTILVDSGQYFKSLSSKDVKKLNKAGVTQTVVYPMSNTQYLKLNVKSVAQMLCESETAEYASTAISRANDYVAFHDRVVKACASANGGLAGKKQYQAGKDTTCTTFAGEDAQYTLLIDEYDATATYTGSSKKGWTPSKGLAFASAGYSTTPVSYYLQAAGLINNAAELTTRSDTGKLAVWQFLTNTFPFKASQWTGNSTTKSAKAGTDYSLLTTSVNEMSTLPFGSSFGSSVFPTLIVTSESIKTALINNSALENGTYHPYSHVKSTGVIDGYKVAEDSNIFTCIGFDGDKSTTENLLGSTIGEEHIAVNPRGLTGSWTEGSVEAFLEAAWANDVVNAGSEAVGWESELKSFYQEFYDYTLTDADLATIKSGETE